MQILLIDGLPVSGKSTAAKQIEGFIKGSGRAATLYLEMESRHPLHLGTPDEDGTAFADIHKLTTPGIFAESIVASWKRMSYPSGTTILDSFPLQSHIRVLMQMDAPIELIDSCWARVLGVLAPHQPTLLFFSTAKCSDLLEWTLKTRGPRWIKYVVEGLQESPYMKNRGWHGLDGVCLMMQDYSNLMERLVDSWRFDKMIFPAKPSCYEDRWAGIKSGLIDRLESPQELRPGSAAYSEGLRFDPPGRTRSIRKFASRASSV